MTIQSTFRLLGATAMIAGLSACGGGSDSGGGEASYTMIQPMQGMTAEDYQALQDRGVVAEEGEPMAFSSLASTQTTDAPFSGAVGYRNDGTITFNAGRIVDGEVVETPSINAAIGQNDDNELSYNPDYRNGTNNLGNPVITASQGQINGQAIYLGRRDEDAQSTSVVYIPRGDSNMYVGAYASDIHGSQGLHGVFGRETTSAEMSRLNGTATYRGVAAASVSRSQQGSAAEGGYYEGTSSASVNFDTNRLDMDIDLSRDRELSAGTDRIDMSVRDAQIGSGGRIQGTATYGGLTVSGGTVTGSMDGHFFGPHGESIGSTFIGTSESNGNHGHIVGHTVLNQD